MKTKREGDLGEAVVEAQLGTGGDVDQRDEEHAAARHRDVAVRFTGMVDVVVGRARVAEVAAFADLQEVVVATGRRTGGHLVYIHRRAAEAENPPSGGERLQGEHAESAARRLHLDPRIARHGRGPQ
ncbi:MAG: hypothetical protein KDK06_18510 [Gammaproteobacteria bacterium]|nr:hypothetical protein [Gammaproteobacteria bacterium]